MRGCLNCCCLAVCWLLATLGLGCSENGVPYEQYSEAVEFEKTSSGLPAAETSKAGPALASSSVPRHVIYDADVDLIVDDFVSFGHQLPNLVAANGGYVADVVINQRRSSRKGTWKVKVRSTDFQAFFNGLEKLGVIENHHQTAKDVTDQFVDLSARIVNKKRMEQRILELINAKRDLQEVIGLEKELGRIRGDIERMQGHLNSLAKKTEFASITITAIEERQPEPIVALSFVDRVRGSWDHSVELLSAVVQHIAVVTAYLLPWLVVIGLLLIPVYLLRRWYLKREANLAVN